MADPIHVLVAGWSAPSATAAAIRDARLGVLAGPLAAHDVAIEPWERVSLRVPPADLADPAAAARRGAVALEGDELPWADVILLRASDLAVWACDVCDRVGFDPESATEHARSGRHEIAAGGGGGLQTFLDGIEAKPTLLRNRALVFDLDQGLRSCPPDDLLRHEPIRRAVRLADLTLVSTAPLARDVEAAGGEARVVRAAVDPAWTVPLPATEPTGPLGVVGDAAEVAPLLGAVRRPEAGGSPVWLTWERAIEARVTRFEPPLAADEVTAALAGLSLRAGLCLPTGSNGTEWWWLAFALAGVPAIVSGARGSGYEVIRDGVDGLVARTPDEWRDALARLDASPSLGRELVTAARERIGREYDVASRAAELADALRWAAAHAGRARVRQAVAAARRSGRAAADPLTVAEVESAAVLAHRQRFRRRTVEDAETLERLRHGREVCWREDMPDEPLVSVVIPTYSRGSILVERSLASILSQTYRNIEVVVVGDHATPETLEAIAAVDDPRVRFYDLPERSPYHEDPFLRWLQVGTRPYNKAIELARGDFIAPNADDDEFTPNHVELLLSVALEYRLEFVYGDAEMEFPDGSWNRVGAWPPREGGICGGAILYAAPLRFIEMDEECWRDLEPNDWNHFRRMLEAGARAGHVPEIVFRHYREGREWRGSAVPAAAGAH